MYNQPTHKAKSLDGQWVEGWYDGSNPESQLIWFNVNNTWYNFHEINPTTLCRSTYRTDSNGKLMYEGDEVEVKDWEGSMRSIAGIYTIAWDEVTCCFCMIADDKEAITFNEVDYYTITGKNKHD